MEITLSSVKGSLLLFLTGCRPTHHRSRRAQKIGGGMLLDSVDFSRILFLFN